MLGSRGGAGGGDYSQDTSYDQSAAPRTGGAKAPAAATTGGEPDDDIPF
jgi:hypothetical protein